MNGSLMTTITPKFQIHIPTEIRRRIGIINHGRAKIYAEGKKIIIESAIPGALSVAGKFKIKHPFPVEKIRDYIDYSNL
jgi:bifunctional DNA-binding transcriptional regulator/antitoxin component of YhaV-PrlF toxin-antitoxin module